MNKNNLLLTLLFCFSNSLYAAEGEVKWLRSQRMNISNLTPALQNKLQKVRREDKIKEFKRMPTAKDRRMQ